MEGQGLRKIHLRKQKEVPKRERQLEGEVKRLQVRCLKKTVLKTHKELEKKRLPTKLLWKKEQLKEEEETEEGKEVVDRKLLELRRLLWEKNLE